MPIIRTLAIFKSRFILKLFFASKLVYKSKVQLLLLLCKDFAAAAMANIHSFLPPLFHSEDAKEGVMAMVERRAAEFKGK